MTNVTSIYIATWTKDNNIPSDSQNGLRKGRSTVDHGNCIVDYFAVSNCLLSAFQRLVEERRVESDRMSVETYLNCAISRGKHKQDTAIQKSENIFWCPDKKSVLVDKLTSVASRKQ